MANSNYNAYTDPLFKVVKLLKIKDRIDVPFQIQPSITRH